MPQPPARPQCGAAAAARPPEDPDPASEHTPAPAILDRALGYPYARPDSSFVFHAGAAHEFADERWPPAGALATRACVRALGLACDRAAAATLAALDAGLTPVLAIGSNAGPAQLARKYAGPDYAATAVPSTRALLTGFDVCYAPLVSSYGSVTATLTPAPSPQTAVEVYVSWLDPAALERMHETEAAYDLVSLDVTGGAQGSGGLALGTSAAASSAGRPPAAWHRGHVLCYVHQHGSLLLPPAALAVAGAPTHHTSPTPVALAEVAAVGRSFPALTQAQAQAAVAALVGAQHDSLDSFIVENVTGPPSIRAARVATLASHASPFAHPAATRLATLGSVFGRSVD